MSVAAPATAFETILAWAQRDQCPTWQSDALRRLVAEGKLTSDDLSQLVLLVKRENGASEIDLQPMPLSEGHLPANPLDNRSISLLCLRNTAGVNQLASEQELHFEPTGLNVIYGDNGAGKSGYARVLKRACRARFRGKIIPNAFDDNTPVAAATAVLEVHQGDSKADPIDWTDGPEPHPVLSAVSVFDRQSGAVHLTAKNDVAFRPYGLDIPDELANACSEIRNELTAEQGQLQRQRHVTFSAPPWSPETPVGRILNSLSAETELSTLIQLATLSEAEKKRLAQLQKDLAQDLRQAAAEKRVLIESFERLAGALTQLEKSASDDYLKALTAKALDAREKRVAAELAAASAFDDAPVTGIGGAAWRTLFDSAIQFAEHTAYVGEAYPNSSRHQHCVLCQQSLSPEAVGRLSSFRDYLRLDVSAKAQDAEDALSRAREEFAAAEQNHMDHVSVRSQVALVDAVLARDILRLFAIAKVRRKACLAAISEPTFISMAPWPTNTQRTVGNFVFRLG